MIMTSTVDGAKFNKGADNFKAVVQSTGCATCNSNNGVASIDVRQNIHCQEFRLQCLENYPLFMNVQNSVSICENVFHGELKQQYVPLSRKVKATRRCIIHEYLANFDTHI